MKIRQEEINCSPNRRYCCYRHFIEGKPAKDSTYCYSHVPLGVINPIPTQKPVLQGQLDNKIEILPKKFRIQNRTHDYNQIQNKSSLPRRLIDPKVYIQKIVPKNTHNPFSLQSTKQIIVRSRFYESQYDILFGFLKKIGKFLPKPSKQSLHEVIIEFMRKHSLKAHQKILPMPKQDFINLMVSQFCFPEKDANEFWQLVYNDRRFKSSKYDSLSKNGQIISMQAFLHNFDRIYLSETQKFVNLLSEAALKQRVIDIRHFLHDWYKFNIFYKLNMIEQTNRELLICEYLKKFGQSEQPSDNQSLYSQMIDLIQRRNYQYLKIRLISKFIYNITDDKYLSYDKLHDTILHKIEEETKLLETSLSIIKNFLEIKEYTIDEKFGMPEIIEFMKDEQCEEREFMVMSRYLRRLVKYLYFNKMGNADHYGIAFVRETLKFECESILELTPQILAQFSEYMKENTQIVSGILLESFMKYLENQVMENFHQKVQASDMQNQQKIAVMQCNFLAEGIKRFLANSDLICFRTLIRIADSYTEICGQGNINKIRQIINEDKRLNNESAQVKKTLKGMFKLKEYPFIGSEVTQSIKEVAYVQTLEDKFENYKNAGKLATEVQAALKKPAIQNESQQQNMNGISIPELDSPQLLEIKKQLKVSMYEENSKNVQSAHSCCGSHHIYSTDISLETINSISAVQNLEDKLFDLLGL